MLDLLIRGATLLDGTGAPRFTGAVGVKDGLITEVGKVAGPAKQAVEAAGLALMPGIVDLHTHYDAQVTWDRTLSPSPALGVTTAVLGNCGFGIAPCPAPQRQTVLRNLSVVEGMDLTALEHGVNWEAESFADYLAQLRRIGPCANVAVLAQHSTIRSAVMGEEASMRAEPTSEELAAMQAQVREAMEA
ncbi:MAG: amidohydrolase family protein, partial [Betaproteobacteria bacterium]|nr:amidohydrolase family protein [Betaproteobacteria bacterium]